MRIVLIGMKSGATLRLQVADGKALVEQLCTAHASVNGSPAGSGVWYVESGRVVLNVMQIEYVVPESALAKEGDHGQG